jgi:uncharacterized membrane protein
MAAPFSRTPVTAFREQLNSSFWFAPAVMVVVAVALFFLMIEVDAVGDVA